MRTHVAGVNKGGKDQVVEADPRRLAHLGLNELARQLRNPGDVAALGVR